MTGAVLASCQREQARSPEKRAAPPPPAPVASTPEAPKHVVTVLGDSITAGFGLGAHEAMPAQLEQALRQRGLDVQVRSAGVSGDTTAGGLARVAYSVPDETDVAVVALGGNDMLQGVEPAQVRANLDRIIESLKGRGIVVVLAGMRAPAHYGSYAAEFEQVFRELARSHDVRLYPFLLEGVALDPRLNQADRIHPNAQGARVIAERLAPLVAEVLRKASGEAESAFLTGQAGALAQRREPG